MPDREKVLTWFEICGKNRDCSGNCPYSGELCGEDEMSRCREDLMTDALALLEEQEAVVPDTNGYEWVCGRCKYPVELERKTSPQTWFHSTLYNYCPNCGKKVKWNDN